MEFSLKNMKNVPCVQEAIKNISTSHFDKICRSCLLQQDDVKPIFRLTFENMNFSTLFETCASIQVNKDDCLPRNICDECIRNFVRVYCFIRRCKHSNEVLRLLSKNEGIKQKVRERSEFEESESNLEQQQSNEIIRPIEISENTPQKHGVQENFDSAEIVWEDNSIKKNKKNFVPQISYVCRSCNLDFKSVDDLREHKRQEKHPNGYNRLCPICQKIISRHSVIQHMRIHTNEKPFMCNICSKKFRSKCTLRRHIKIHTGERPYICDICGRGFIQSQGLKEHRRIHTGETPYICNYCGKMFKQYAPYTIHLHKHKVEIDECGESNYKCKMCNKIFSSKAALHTHNLLHKDKKFLCNECGKGFYTKAGLQSHVKIHTGARPYSCHVCSKTFAYLTVLKSHELVHTKLKPFVCEICLKSFRHKHKLNIHLRTHTS